MFLRADLPAELTAFRASVERALAAEGLHALDTGSSLAKPLARELLGVDGAQWDLWGKDLAEVFAVMAARTGGTAADASTGYTTAAGAGSAADASRGASSTPTTSARAGSDTPAGAPAEPPPSQGRRSPPKILLALGLVLLLVLAAAVFLTQRAQNDPPAAGPEPTAEPVPQAPLVDYADPAGRFTLKYPETWRPVELNNPEVALLLLGPEGASMLVRIVTLEKPVDVANIPDVKAVTDVIVQGPSVQILQERPIDLPEAKGYYYLYRFQDQATQQQGVHSHFFLFKGAALHTLVFQALPFEEFARFASDFDRIAQSYRLIS